MRATGKTPVEATLAPASMGSAIALPLKTATSRPHGGLLR